MRKSANGASCSAAGASFNDPEICDYTYKNMNAWGRGMYVTPGVIVDGKLVTTDLVDINLGIRILLGSSFYDDWDAGETYRQGGPARPIPSTNGIRGTRRPLRVRKSATWSRAASTPG